MKKIKYSHYDRIFILVIAIISLILNFVYGYSKYSTIYSGVMLGMIDVLTFSTYLLIARTPVLSNIILLIASSLTFVYDLISGATVREAADDMGVSILFCVIAIIIVSLFNKKNIVNTFDISDTKKDKLCKYILFDRKIHNIRWYYKIMMYSIMIVFIMTLSNSTMLNTYISGTDWRVYAALTVAFPFIKLISLLSTTTIAYEIYGLFILAQAFTVYMQAQTDKLDVVSLLFVIEQIIVLCYSVYRCNELNKETQENK
jgi:hypothetical protein